MHIVVVPANEALDPSKFSPKRCSRLGTNVFLLQLKSDQELCVSYCYFILVSKDREEVFLPKVVVRC